MQKFISCDWGTSSFRLRLVDVTTQAVLAEVKSNKGIAETDTLWNQQAKDEAKRFSFYQSVIQEHLKELQKQVGYSLQDMPLIVSGMASSSIGMVELPYKELPLALDGSDLEFKKLNATESFQHDVVLISGVKTSNDVMRGEETQLIGCDFRDDDERIYIFPGTHSKHVTVKYHQVTDFKTYMTGEFFHLLSHQSILSKSVQESSHSLSGDALKGFEDGVAQSLHDNLLHNSFLVRTNHLFGGLPKQQNYHYLSGLLIGTELKELVSGEVPITIVANAVIQVYYTKALQKLGISNIETLDVDLTLVKGHCKVYHLHYSNRLHPKV